MKDRSVIVDVAIDQGGCIETIRRTTRGTRLRRARRRPLRWATSPAVPYVDLRAHQRATPPTSATSPSSGPPAPSALTRPLAQLPTGSRRVTRQVVAESLGQPLPAAFLRRRLAA